MELAGIVLAGGLSTRMGSDKALLEFRGKTLIENAVQIMRHMADTIYISTASDRQYHISGVTEIKDNVKAVGPMGGLLSILSSKKADAYFILPCDLPLMNATILNQVKKQWQNDVTTCTIAVSKKGLEPLIGIYPAAILETLRQNIAGRSYAIRDLLKKTGYNRVEVQYDDSNFDPFWNVNYIKDYKDILLNSNDLIVES